MIELEKGLKKLKGRAGEPIRRPTVSTNPNPRELPETEPPTIQQTWGPMTYIAEEHLDGLASVKMHLILEKLKAPGKKEWDEEL